MTFAGERTQMGAQGVHFSPTAHADEIGGQVGGDAVGGLGNMQVHTMSKACG